MEYAIQLKNVTKTFGKVVANKNVNLNVRKGEILSLLGENGSGKTTLMNMISGIYFPDSGEILVDGKHVEIRSPKDAYDLGIGMIHQHFKLIDVFSATENIALGLDKKQKFDLKEVRKKAQAICDKYHFDLDLNQKVYEMSVSQKQTLEIVKVLYRGANILILDEPTASLNETDSKALLDLMLELKKKGMTSIIISHKLNEISYVADKITVIRDGSTIETLVKGKDDITESRIIKGMVGREIADRFPKREPKIGDVRMEVKHWTVHHPLYSERKVVDDVNIIVKKGEVVGISGLMGAGRTELAMSLFGKSYGSNISGELYINGKIVHLNTVQEAIKNHLAYVTEDRKGNGLILSNPIKINTTLANLDAVSSHTVIDKDKEYNVAVDYKKKLNTKCPTVEQNVGNLSGGNQQKVLLAKWMFADPDILILDEPTRGIDVGAKYEIYCIINQLVAEGKSVIMISSELPEILGMCDRIYVMNEGKIVGELAGSEATQELIMSKILSAGKKGALA